MNVAWLAVKIGSVAHAVPASSQWTKSLCGYRLRRWFCTTAEKFNPRCKRCERVIDSAERRGEGG